MYIVHTMNLIINNWALKFIIQIWNLYFNSENYIMNLKVVIWILKIVIWISSFQYEFFKILDVFKNIFMSLKL
jgi:hypothetical protein